MLHVAARAHVTRLLVLKLEETFVIFGPGGEGEGGGIGGAHPAQGCGSTITEAQHAEARARQQTLRESALHNAMLTPARNACTPACSPPSQKPSRRGSLGTPTLTVLSENQLKTLVLVALMRPSGI